MSSLIKKYEWQIEDSREGEEGDAFTIYRDIFQWEDVVAERVVFDDAEALVLRHNRNLHELASELAHKTVYRKGSHGKSLDCRGIDLKGQTGKTCES